VPAQGDLVFFGKNRVTPTATACPTPYPRRIVIAVTPRRTAMVVTATMSRVVALPMNRLRPNDATDDDGETINAGLLTPASPTRPQLYVTTVLYIATSINPYQVQIFVGRRRKLR